MQELTGQDIICVSTVDWDPLWTRKQQIMSRLPASNRILYVEPPQSYIAHIKDPQLAAARRLAGQPPRRLRDNLWVYKPRRIVPFASRFAGINPFNQRRLAEEIRHQAGALGLRDYILWTYNHTSCDLCPHLPYRLMVYDCVDEHGAYAGFNYQLVRRMEQRLVKASDLTFCTARGLYETRQTWAREIWLSPNAADVEHFAQADTPQAREQSPLAALPGPVLGFIGAVKEWIDLDLLLAAAQEFAQGSLVIIGPVGAGLDVSRLERLPNVHLLGRRERQDLPGFLAGMDVCLNPFRQDELTINVSPLKFYEYLASGRPIASVPMPELADFKGLVEFGAGAQGFVQAIRRALDDNPRKQEARREASRENSWEQRTAMMMDKIAAHLVSPHV